MVTELEPVAGPRATCPVCGNELLGQGTIEHNEDGSHSYTPTVEESAEWQSQEESE